MNENKVSTTGDVSDTIVTEYTTTQTSFPSLSVGEKLKVVFGKINKFISDVKNWKTTVDENLETNTAAIDQLNSDLAGKYDSNRIAPFVAGVPVTNGKGHVNYNKNLVGNGFAVIISNDSMYYVRSENPTSTGFDFTLHTMDGSVANVTIEEFWISGATFVYW